MLQNLLHPCNGLFYQTLLRTIPALYLRLPVCHLQFAGRYCTLPCNTAYIAETGPFALPIYTGRLYPDGYWYIYFPVLSYFHNKDVLKNTVLHVVYNLPIQFIKNIAMINITH